MITCSFEIVLSSSNVCRTYLTNNSSNNYGRGLNGIEFVAEIDRWIARLMARWTHVDITEHNRLTDKCTDTKMNRQKTDRYPGGQTDRPTHNQAGSKNHKKKKKQRDKQITRKNKFYYC